MPFTVPPKVPRCLFLDGVFHSAWMEGQGYAPVRYAVRGHGWGFEASHQNAAGDSVNYHGYFYHDQVLCGRIDFHMHRGEPRHCRYDFHGHLAAEEHAEAPRSAARSDPPPAQHFLMSPMSLKLHKCRAFQVGR